MRYWIPLAIIFLLIVANGIQANNYRQLRAEYDQLKEDYKTVDTIRHTLENFVERLLIEE